MSGKVEGTLLLDGLIEGRLPDVPDAETRLQQWVRFAASRHLQFHVEFEGRGFSILAESKPVSVEPLGSSPDQKIADTLNNLLSIFPSGDRENVLSTVRSMEYRPKTEVQTVYVVGPGGTIQAQQRMVDAETIAPAPQLTRRDKVRLALTGVIIALLILLVSAFFVDYRQLIGHVIERAMPLDADKVQVDAKRFSKYFTVEKKTVARDRRAIVLTLKRGEEFPRRDEDFDRLLGEGMAPLEVRLALEALARGYVRCECFDENGDLLKFTFHHVAGLREKEAIDVVVPIPKGERTNRIVIAY